MTAALAEPPTPTTAARRRGRLDIAPTVVERVAEGTARRVPGVQLVHKRFGSDTLPVSARVLGTVASLHLDLAVAYPSPVRETCRRVRAEVTKEVRRLTGIDVSRLDVDVVDLRARRAPTQRVR